MYTFIESRIDWSFYKHTVDKTPEATTYKFVMRGQAQDVRENTTSDGHVYRSMQTDLFGDSIAAVASIIIKRYNKGGQLMKDHISAHVIPAVSFISNAKGQTFFATEEETQRVINEAAQQLIETISENGGFMLPRPLTVGGKAILNAAARKKDKCRLEVGRITTRIADRDNED